ncbi:SSI family serine proteinase inhibitor [Pseudokineococcus sp. 1T1Z-3]|uniref:SSI family serine proteinase inhibitor n=1 Tax=Pseudokineococcus sp. 1T1Z-3 TaxID=3132745 RepID=UPI0030B1C375
MPVHADPARVGPARVGPHVDLGAASRTRRPRRSSVGALLPGLALVVALGACGQDGDDVATGAPSAGDPVPSLATPTEPSPTGPSPTGPGSTDPGPTDPGTTDPGDPDAGALAPPVALGDLGAEITVQVDDGQGNLQTYDLVCDGEQGGGTAPNPAAACEALAAAGGARALGLSAPNQSCTQVFGGPETAVVSGTVNGEVVSADLSRSDGCEISRWDALVPLVPAAGA